ncbi:MAG: cupin domain-containing protein [Gammaproteobacteria bacterium]
MAIHPATITSEDGLLGDKLRALRKSRGLTLKAVADASGISIGHLSELERDLASPSVKMLHDISRALGVSISWFFDGDESDTAALQYVVRGAERARIRFGEGITDYKLNSAAVRRLGLLHSVFAPGASSGEEPYTHDGEEAGVVLTGALELWIDGHALVLEAGDSFSFPSTLPHRYRNSGDSEAVVVWAMTPPSY